MNNKVKLLFVLFLVSIASLTKGQVTQENSDLDTSGNNLLARFNGTFIGSAYQYNVHETWSIELVCENNKCYVTYPDPEDGCSGYWELLHVESDQLVFKETINEDPENNCLNGVIVKVKAEKSERIVSEETVSSQVNINGKIFDSVKTRFTTRTLDKWVLFFYYPDEEVLIAVGGVRNQIKH